MDILRQSFFLMRKDVQLEWRQRAALSGLLLYVLCTVLTAYMSFGRPQPIVWHTVFWIILLFASVNAVAKSFMQESTARQLYYYTLFSPQAVILSKLLYNILLLLLLALLGLLTYTLLLGNPVKDWGLFLAVVLLGALGFSMCFTLVSAIAAKASKNATLMPILSLPLIVPILSLLINVSKAAVTGIGSSNTGKDIAILLAIDGIMGLLSLILFPYLWRD